MTIPAGQTGITIHAGTGSATVFDYEFRINSAQELVVTLDSGSGPVLQTLNVDYTVQGVGAADGGTITMAVAPIAFAALQIVDNVVVSQETPFSNQGQFYGQSHENALDKLTRLVRRALRISDNAIRLPDLYKWTVDHETPAPVSAGYFRWNSAGNAIEFGSLPPATVPEGGLNSATTDFIYWKPAGQAAFFYCTGQSLTEPAYPLHPDAVPLTRCDGVLIWRSDGNGANWDFRVFDPDQPLSNDFQEYDATTNPNGRAWSLNDDGDLRWDEPYTGYGGGGFYSWFIGMAIQYYESTGRKVYIGNTAWGGRSSFQWYPGAVLGVDSWGQCSAQIDYHMPLMQARLAELEPDLETLLWDAFAFNQSSTDAGIEQYGYPPETYVGNWTAFFDHVGETEDDGYGQPVPIRWMDPSKCMIAMLERTKRDENFPWWNGQEMLLEAYGGRMQMVTSAKRLIWDTEGDDGETGTLPGSPAYNLHFWGDVCIDFGRDVTKHLMSNGCGKARTEVLFQRHNTSTKFIKGTYTFSSNTLGGIADPGTGNIGTQSTTHVCVSKTDDYGNAIPFEDIETGDILYIFNRNNRTQFFSATVNAVTVEADYVGFTTSATTAAWTPAVGYVVDVEVNRRVYLTETVDDETTYYADSLYRDPYKRRGINYANASMPNATDCVKAHDEVGHVLHLESLAEDITRMFFDVYLRDTVGEIEAAFSHSAKITFKGPFNSIDTLDVTTGENKMAMAFIDGYALPANAVFGSIRAVNNATAVALSGTTAATAIWNTNHDAKGLTVDESTGSITVLIAGRYRVFLMVQSGTMTASKRTVAYISINGTPSSYFGVMESNAAGEIGTFSIEGTFPLAANDVIDVDFLPLDGATTTTVKYAELYAKLIETA